MKLYEVIKAFTDVDDKIKTVGMIIEVADNREDKLISQGYIVPLPTALAESFLKQIRDLGIEILSKFEDVFKEQESVPVALNATTTETDILHLDIANTRYLLREITLKAEDPGADTITISLHGLVNDVLTTIDTFEITTANFGAYFNLIDMFGLADFPGDKIKITATTDAGSYAITGQYSYALTGG